MDLINNNQKQNLPYLNKTISSIKNSQVSGFNDHNLNKHGAKLSPQTSFEYLTDYNNNLTESIN